MIYILTILFWTALFTLVYHYVLFPILLNYLAKGKHLTNDTYKTNELPTISVLLAVFNEESVIEEKIKSTFKTSYPLDKIEFLIGSDASNDNTDAIIKKYQEKYPQIKLIRFEGRTGKPQIINQLETKAVGEILILTDANVFFEENCLFELVKHFKDQKIGLVGGNILNLDTKKDGISNQEKAYLSLETKMKYQEGVLWGAMMGAFGGIYAIRKTAYENVPKGYLVDDFYISMMVLIKEYKSINSLEAIAYEDVSNIPEEEFRRKVRIGIGNFQNLFKFKTLIISRFGIAFSFMSHKIIRWKGPFILLFLVLILPFIKHQHYIYDFIGLGVFTLLLTPIIDIIFKKLNLHLKILRFASHFIMMNLALLIGFFKFTFGLYGDTWTPTKRNQ